MKMTLTSIDDPQRKAAKVAGFAGLLTWPLVVYANFAVHARLIVEGNAAETARNILTHEQLFRISIACDLAYSAGLVILLAALYVVLRPVGRSLALFAAFWRLVYALMWIRMTLNLFQALRFLKGADCLRGFETEQLQALASSYLAASFDQYYVGLLFWSLASTVCSYLWFKSRYIPRAWAGFGVVSSVWGTVCTLVLVVIPDFANVVNLWWFDSPMGLFEIGTSLWLLLKGLRPPQFAEPARATEHERA